MAVIRLVALAALLAGVACKGPLLAHAEAPLDVAVWADAGLAPVDAATRAPDLAVVSTLYPVRWRVGLAGTLEPVQSAGLDTLLLLERPEGVRIVPTIQNLGTSGFDAEGLRRILADPAAREALLVALTGLLDTPGVGGLNVDFEGLGEGDRAAFTYFVADLKLRMAGRGLLTVCVPARTAAPPPWDGARFVDWDALGTLADEVVVMAYDYSGQGTAPGPVSPLGWVDAVLDYATAHVPRERLRIGLPLYGYVWTEPTEAAPFAAFPLRDLAGIDRSVWRPAPVPEVHGASSGKVVHLRAVDGDTTRDVYVDDIASLREKIEHVRARGIDKVAFWHLGHASPGVLADLRAR